MKKFLATIIAAAMILSTMSFSVLASDEASLELNAIDEIVENVDAEEEVSELETMADTYLYVSSDYNSETEGWGTTHFVNYSSALNYAKTNAKNATIVIEKTNALGGNCIDHSTHKTLKSLNIDVKDGAIIGNANSKWDVTYDIVLEPGAKLQSARGTGSSVGYTHIKDGGSLTIGEAGSDKKAEIDFQKGKYQDMSIAVLWQGKLTANNALIKIADLGLSGATSFTDCIIDLNGVVAFGKNNYYKHTVTNTIITSKGNYLYEDSTYFSTTGTLLHNLTMTNSSITVDDGVDGTVAQPVTFKTVNMTDSFVTVEKETPVTVSGKVTMTDSQINGGIVTVDSKGSIIMNGSEVTTLATGDGSALNVDELVIEGGSVTVDLNTGLNIGKLSGAGTLTIDAEAYKSGMATKVTIGEVASGVNVVIENDPTGNLSLLAGNSGNLELAEVVATINGTGYSSISKAIEASKAMSGEVVILVKDGTYREDLTIVQQEGLNLTLKAENKGKAVLEGTIVVDGAARQKGAETLTIDGLKFDSTYTDEEVKFIHSKVVIDNSNYPYIHNVTIKNCEFIDDNYKSKVIQTETGGDYNVTIENCTGYGLHSVAQVHNVEGNGLIIKDCVFTNMKNGVNLNSSALTMSNTTLEVKGYAMRAGQPDSGASQIVTITDSILKSEVEEEGKDAPIVIRNGAEKATVNLTNNIVNGNGIDVLNLITGDDSLLTVNANKNYWGGSTPAVNGMTLEVENYYIDEARTILYNISTGLADTSNVSATAKISFSEEPVAEGDDYYVYDMFVEAAEDGKTIANLVSAEADITVTPPNGKSIGLEVIGGDYNVSTSASGKYLFNLKNGLESNVVIRSGEKVKIGQIKLTGYTHAIGNTEEKAIVSVSNAFYNYEQMYDSLVKVQMPIEYSELEYSKTVASKKLEVNIAFPNAVKFNEEIYQNMLLTVNGGDLAEAIEINLDDSVGYVNGDAYKVVFENKLTKDIAYTVTVSAAGYRTARYTVTMNDDKVLNFWNNVKDNAEAVEIAAAGNKGYNTVTFLAGDIVKDNIINIYDLSAVVSYFGEENLSKDNNPGYAKYDLNRDGKIDSKDVAYVLVSWGK